MKNVAFFRYKFLRITIYSSSSTQHSFFYVNNLPYMTKFCGVVAIALCDEIKAYGNVNESVEFYIAQGEPTNHM